MTVPKFRAWYKKSTLPMLKVNLISFDQQFTDVYIDDEAVAETEMSFDFDDVIFMQSTGLEDKNGTEIFEGDVFYDEEVDEIGKVYYKDGCFFGKTDFFDTLLYKIASDIKIIGNIHDNPDLMEVIHEQETT